MFVKGRSPVQTNMRNIKEHTARYVTYKVGAALTKPHGTTIVNYYM